MPSSRLSTPSAVEPGGRGHQEGERAAGRPVGFRHLSRGLGIAVASGCLLTLQPGLLPPVTLAALFLALISLIDAWTGKIPNLIILAVLLAALAWHGGTGGGAGLWHSLAGMVTGLALLALPYLLGGTGGGDVKALGALGALLGTAAILQVFLYTALAGGLLALASGMAAALAAPGRNRCQGALTTLRTVFATGEFRLLLPAASHRQIRFPYAAAIALGFLAHRTWGDLI